MKRHQKNPKNNSGMRKVSPANNAKLHKKPSDSESQDNPTSGFDQLSQGGEPPLIELPESSDRSTPLRRVSESLSPKDIRGVMTFLETATPDSVTNAELEEQKLRLSAIKEAYYEQLYIQIELGFLKIELLETQRENARLIKQNERIQGVNQKMQADLKETQEAKVELEIELEKIKNERGSQNQVVAELKRENKEFRLHWKEVGPGELLPTERRDLRRFLTDRFNLAELRTLMFDMGIDCENYSPIKRTMIEEFILDCERHFRSGLLVQELNLSHGGPFKELSSLQSRFPIHARNKFQLILHNVKQVDLNELIQLISQKLNLPEHEVHVLAFASGSILLLLALPETARQMMTDLVHDRWLAEKYRLEVMEYAGLSNEAQSKWKTLVISGEGKAQILTPKIRWVS